MGLSSSQARLLNLTNRMHQIEYNASRIEAMKLQMANESRRVYEDYLEAMDQAKIQRKTLTTNGAVTFVDVHNYSEFLNAGFALVVHGSGLGDDSTFDTTEVNPAYQDWLDRQATARETWDPDDHGGAEFDDATNGWATLPGNAKPDETVIIHNSISNNSVICQGQDALIQALSQVLNFDATGMVINNFEEFLTNAINCGVVTIIQKDPETNEFPELGSDRYVDLETSVAINTSLQEVTDDVKLRKAEAKYEADMKRIDMKDRRYDSDLAALDNERNAIKQEMETLKTVARDNVDRTFKIFS